MRTQDRARTRISEQAPEMSAANKTNIRAQSAYGGPSASKIRRGKKTKSCVHAERSAWCACAHARNRRAFSVGRSDCVDEGVGAARRECCSGPHLHMCRLRPPCPHKRSCVQ